MKNLFLGLIAAVLLCGVDANAQKITGMSKDPDFVAFVRNHDAFLARGTQKDLLKKIYGDKKLTENELPDFFRVFGTDDRGYRSHMTQQRALLQILDTRYNLLDPKNEEFIAIEVGELYETSNKSCTRTYRNAIAKITALTALGHGACLAADVTVLGGVICHSAVTVWALASVDDAWAAYKECKEDAK